MIEKKSGEKKLQHTKKVQFPCHAHITHQTHKKKNRYKYIATVT